MPSLLPFFIILLAGLILSQLFERLHLPYVPALIIGGILIGPQAFGLLEVTPTMQMIGDIGVIFLLFIAGTESKLTYLSKHRGEVGLIALINGMIPLVVGYTAAYVITGEVVAATIVAVLFAATSAAVLVPTLESTGLIHKKIGQTVVNSAFLQDLVSLLLIAIILQDVAPRTDLPLAVYLLLVALTFFVIWMILPRVKKYYKKLKSHKSFFQDDLRFIITVLFAAVIVFELLGVHAIIAGFIIGALLSDSIDEESQKKLDILGYGLFIPTFFIIVGAQTDVSLLTDYENIFLTVVLALAMFVSKFFSGLVSALLAKFNYTEAVLIGAASMSKLTTTLAVVFTASELDLLPERLITALIIGSIISTLIVPELVKLLSKDIHEPNI
jgi:Kef-type K+ transport system membrane component KefB